MSSHPGAEQLAGLLDDAAGVRPEVAAHVAACPDCRHRVRQLETVRARLATLPPAPVPAGLADRVSAGLHEPRQRRRLQRPGLPALAGVAGALVIVVAGLALHLRHVGGGPVLPGATSRAAASVTATVPFVGATVALSRSGRDYHHSTLAQGVDDMLGEPGAAAAVPAGTQATFAGVDAGCFRALAAAGRLVAVDRARYDGTPALLVVVAEPTPPAATPASPGTAPGAAATTAAPTKVIGTVVGPSCDAQDPDRLDAVAVTLPVG